MSNLHAAFALRNLKAFRQELDGTGPNATAQRNANSGHGAGSGSAGRSWQLREFAAASHVNVKADPNERDTSGRTVLHLACSAPDQRAYEFLQCLLRHQQINVNLQDAENGYTALHRALYAGNIRAARDLLARPDTDVGVKDAEGMTAFDVFNSTVEGTNPAYDAAGTDLYVWGVNRNFTLGVGDPNDRSYPDHVNLSNPSDQTPFATPRIQDISLSKLHSAVLSSSPRSNLQLCGFGSHGRLGRTIHSQYSFQPVPDTPQKITSVSLGQDHTLAVTSGGYVLSWGQNRFNQLGYETESEVQVSPRRIVGGLKKEVVCGVAAGRLASACWTNEAVWTWGTNAGQLGYEKAANPVQILPRKATAISQRVLDIALSDYAMCCLLDTHEVVCLHHDAHFKISFSTPKVLSDAFPFRPPQSTLKPTIVKITAATTTFAALSSIGDVFTFNLPNPLEELAKDVRDRHVTVKPQLIWALRKHFTAVKDVALGSDGTVIISTHSGHVFVRQRFGKAGAGALKFKRIPYLQRVVKVATNDTGAFAAVRVDARPQPIPLTGSVLEEGIGSLQPHMRRFQHQITAADFERISRTGTRYVDEEDDEATNSVAKDTRIALELCTIMSRWDATSGDSLFSWSEPLLGSDMVIVAGGRSTPAHRSIVAQRIPALRKLGALSDGRVRLIERDGVTQLHIDGVHHLSVLLLLQYIYTDDIAAIWDARVARRIQEVFPLLKISIVDVKDNLRDFVQILGITRLEPILASAGKNETLERSLSTDFADHFAAAQAAPGGDVDIVIQLADRDVQCNSLVLRARCPFFEAMLDDADWTRDRGSVVEIDMRHLKWRPMRLAFRFIYEGVEEDLFDYSHQETLDGFLDFVFEVMAAATELLLDRLVLICSRVILRHVNTHNACSLAVEAGFYQASKLRSSILNYIIVCMETMLESGLLDEMDPDTLAELMAEVNARQQDKLPTPKGELLLKQALESNKDWLALQDYPVPRIRAAPRNWRTHRSPKLSPVDFTTTRIPSRGSPSPMASPELTPMVPTSAIDEMFSMDDESAIDGVDKLQLSARATPRASGSSTPVGRSAAPVWKSRAVEAEKKTDMRSIMAEAATLPVKVGASVASPVTPVSKLSQKDRRKLQNAPLTPPLSASASTFTLVASVSATSGASGAGYSPWRKPTLPLTPVSAVDSTFSPSLAESRAKPSVIPNRSQRPTMTPVKAAPVAGTRRTSSDAAWINSTAFAPTPVALSPGTSLSLLDIQRQERDHSNTSKTRKAQSLVEIQEEERRAEVEKANEEDFLRWWKDEEARVAAEVGSNAGGVAGPIANRRGRGGGRGRGAPRRVPARGGAASAQSVPNHEGQASQEGGSKRGRGRASKAIALQSEGMG